MLFRKTILRNKQDGKIFIEFRNGEAKVPLKISKSKQTGTQITFLPSKEVFSSIKFSANILIKRMRIGLLNKGIKITFIDDTKKVKY